MGIRRSWGMRSNNNWNIWRRKKKSRRKTQGKTPPGVLLSIDGLINVLAVTNGLTHCPRIRRFSIPISTRLHWDGKDHDIRRYPLGVERERGGSCLLSIDYFGHYDRKYYDSEEEEEEEEDEEEGRRKNRK